jgi:hypothetical protein
MNDDDLLGEVTEEERAEAEALARALEKPTTARPGSDAAFALAMRASHHHQPPSDAVAEHALDVAIEERRRHRRGRTWWPVLLAAVVLLVAVPAASRIGSVLAPTRPEAIAIALPTADAILGAPPADDQRASERLEILTRARSRAYFEGLADRRGAPRGGR